MNNKMLILAFLLLMAGRVFGQEDAISKYFHEYEGREDFTTISITSKMFSLIAEMPENEEEGDVMNVIRKLTGLKILISNEFEDSGKLYKEAFSNLTGKGYESLMIINEGDEEIRFLIKEANGKIHELIMLISGEEHEFFLMSMVGDLRLEDISKLSKTLDIDGFEHLEKVDDRP